MAYLIPLIHICKVNHGAVNRGSVRHLSWRTRIGTLEDYYRLYAKGQRFDFLFFVRATIDKRAGSPLEVYVAYGTVPYRTVPLFSVYVLQILAMLLA